MLAHQRRDRRSRVGHRRAGEEFLHGVCRAGFGADVFERRGDRVVAGALRRNG